MSTSRPYDLVILGATGFTGQYVVDEVARVAEEEGLKWAVAGRNMERLQKVLEQASRLTGKSLEETPIIIADVNNEASLLEMSGQTKVVLNCVGPYQLYGEPVIRACIESQASQVDISGEPLFLEKVQLLYSDKAKSAGIHIVGSCGFDSIPADLGVFYASSKFEGQLNAVEGYFNLSAGPDGAVFHTGTLESAACGFGHTNELKTLRRSLFPEPLPKSDHPLPKKFSLFYNEKIDKWCLPFLGSDRSVIQRTQRYFYEKKHQHPVQFEPYFCRPSRWAAYGLIIFSFIFAFMAKFSFTRHLLLQFPGLFTFGVFKNSGPTEKQMKETGFSWTFIANGYSKVIKPSDKHEEQPDKTITVKVTGPEPGYVATPICMVQAAVVLLKDKTHLPEGGVYTPASVFANTNLVERLDAHGIKFQVLNETSAE